MERKHFLLVIISVLILTAGCSDVQGDEYDDSPDEIKDGSLDYQDYKEAGCPYLDGSLDQKTMKKCNEWIRNQTETPEKSISPTN